MHKHRIPTATSAPLRPLRLGLLACALASGLASPALAAKKKARPAATAEPAIAYAQRADAMQLAAEIAQRRGLPEDWVRATLAQARFLPQVPRLMTPPARGFVKNWSVLMSVSETTPAPSRMPTGVTRLGTSLRPSRSFVSQVSKISACRPKRRRPARKSTGNATCVTRTA